MNYINLLDSDKLIELTIGLILLLNLVQMWFVSSKEKVAGRNLFLLATCCILIGTVLDIFTQSSYYLSFKIIYFTGLSIFVLSLYKTQYSSKNIGNNLIGILLKFSVFLFIIYVLLLDFFFIYQLYFNFDLFNYVKTAVNIFYIFLGVVFLLNYLALKKFSLLDCISLAFVGLVFIGYGIGEISLLTTFHANTTWQNYYFPLPAFLLCDMLLLMLVTNAIIFFSISRTSYKLNSLTHIDYQTKVLNRHAIVEEMEAIFKKTYDSVITIILFDIDHLKKINIEYGEDVGDSLINEIVYIMRNCLRDSDRIARIDGEQFLILLPQSTQERGREIAERIRQKIASHHFYIKNNNIRCTVSAGIADSKQVAAAGFTQLQKAAADALYAAKHNGRNQSLIYPIRNQDLIG